MAVTYAPGLIGALLVGVNFAKAAALAMNVPLVPVHHIRGHIAANYLAFPELEPPFLCLAISGGNTMLVDVRGYTDMRVLGATRDDAAGECFDKTARVLGLPYPGGKPLDDLSQGGDDGKYRLPIGHVEGEPYEMSFSGLKTAVINLVHTAEQRGEELDRASLAASFCRAVSESLVPRTMAAAKELGYGKIAVAGGVAANSRIRRDFAAAAERRGRPALHPAAAPLRRQCRHDRRAGLLRIHGRGAGGGGPQRPRHHGALRPWACTRATASGCAAASPSTGWRTLTT